MERIWQDTARAIRGLWDQDSDRKRLSGVGLSGQAEACFW